MSTTTTTNPARGPVDVPDTTRPIRPAPRNLSKPPPAPRMAPDEEIGDDRPSDAPAPTPEPADEAPKKKPTITISTTVQHRGRTFTISGVDMKLDAFCDLLDEAGYAPLEQAPAAAPLATPDDLPEGWKLCKKHGAPMRPRNKQNEHWHSHNVGTRDNPIWCKGYRGADSPGYEV